MCSLRDNWNLCADILWYFRKPVVIFINTISFSYDKHIFTIRNFNEKKLALNMFAHSFYARRSQKRKKYSQAISLFCTFGICVRKMLVKLTPGEGLYDPWSFIKRIWLDLAKSEPKTEPVFYFRQSYLSYDDGGVGLGSYGSNRLGRSHLQSSFVDRTTNNSNKSNNQPQVTSKYYVVKMIHIDALLSLTCSLRLQL